MSDAESCGSYEAPLVRDYGDLTQLTTAVHLLLGEGAAPDLTFSAPAGGGATVAGAGSTAAGGAPSLPSAGVGTQSVLPEAASGGVTDGAHGASGGAGAAVTGGGDAAGGGGGGQLPFTGFAAAGAAAVGVGLTAAGSAIRRGMRRRRA